MKDFLGNTIEIGDTIVYSDTGGRGWFVYPVQNRSH